MSNGNPYHPVLGELCSTGNPAALCAVPNPSALDWLHTDAISYSPADGNLIVSLRHQDWIVKIAYQNGRGDGHVIWRLGKNGDFIISSTEPNPSFSHQHDPHYVGLATIALFDNGNSRCTAEDGSIIAGCDSRGQALRLDEPNRSTNPTAPQHSRSTPTLADSPARWAAPNNYPRNNYAFGAGFFSDPPCIPGPTSYGRSIETLSDGSQAYVQQVNALEYRSFRVAGLYLGTDLG
jgi:Arylsulfotransferase (ASST)